MSAQWLAQLPGSVLAIAGGVHAASHEAGRLADTKHPGWRPVGKSRSGQVGVRESVRATTRVMSGNASAQYPAQLPGNCRESAGQCPGNISCGVPRIIHAASNESSGCLPGNCRAVSGQRPGNVPAIATLQSARHPRKVRKPGQSVSSPRPYPITIQRHSVDYDIGMDWAIREWLQKHRALWAAAQ